MLNRRRGQSTILQRDCISQYLQHKLWPQPYSEGRSADPLLHILAYYVEQWVSHIISYSKIENIVIITIYYY